MNCTCRLFFDFEISARLRVIRAGLQFLDPHLFQEPAIVDLLRRDCFKPLNELGVPIVTLHPHERPARLIDPQENIGILGLAGRRTQLQLPAVASPNIFLTQDTRGLPVEKFKREIPRGCILVTSWVR